MNKKTAIGALVVVVVGIGAYAFFNRPISAGPYGGDLVPVDDGAAYAEVLANKDSGELMAHVWDKNLKTPHPIPNEPITVGSDNDSVQLMPHPMPNDPAGTCSRFYGQADWARNANMHHGWLRTDNQGQSRHEFAWNRCWRGGQSHGNMWQEMQGHHRMGASGHGQHGGQGPGAHGMGR